MRELNKILLFDLAYKLTKAGVFTVWDDEPFQLGQEYLGIARKMDSGFYQIGLNPGLVENVPELKFTWLHELAHIVRGHVGAERPNIATDDWVKHREHVADSWARVMLKDADAYTLKSGMSDEQLFFLR